MFLPFIIWAIFHLAHVNIDIKHSVLEYFDKSKLKAIFKCGKTSSFDSSKCNLGRFVCYLEVSGQRYDKLDPCFGSTKEIAEKTFCIEFWKNH